MAHILIVDDEINIRKVVRSMPNLKVTKLQRLKTEWKP